MWWEKEVKTTMSHESDEEKRAKRQQPDRIARKKAIAIYAAIMSIEPKVEGVDNRGNLFEKTIAVKVLKNEPVALAGFWGKGNKLVPDANDLELIEYLRKIDSLVRLQYSRGVQIILILADKHAEFNGYKPYDGYLDQIQGVAETYGISSVRLSALYEKWGLNLPDVESDLDSDTDAYTIFLRNREQLVKSASRHGLGGVDPEQAAYHYVAMRLNEKAMLAKEFSEQILFVNGSKGLTQDLLPRSLPVMYLPIGPVWFY